MTQANHTPLPWYSAPNDFSYTIYPVEGPKDGVMTSYGHYRDKENKEVDAAFIVRACNSHYELLELARQVVLCSEVEGVEIPHDILDGAKAAIAKAEGGTK